MPNQAHDAFVSYAREDGEFALRLAKDLKAAEALVWMDQLDIKPGERWDLVNCPGHIVTTGWILQWVSV
jgi:hypothetical protein